MLCRWFGINAVVLRNIVNVCTGFWGYICFIPPGGTKREIIFTFIAIILNKNVYYTPTYAQISTVNSYKITATCFAVNTQSSDSLQLC